MMQGSALEPPTEWGDFVEAQDVFQPRPIDSERDYDAEGWRYPGDVMLGIVNEMVANLDSGAPIGATTGDDMRRALEIAVGLRESARRGHTPVSLPMEDRSISMLPQKSRWFYKKTLMGREAYMQQLAVQKKD